MNDTPADDSEEMFQDIGQRLFEEVLGQNPQIDADEITDFLNRRTTSQEAAMILVQVASKEAVRFHDPSFLTPAVQCLAMTGFFGNMRRDPDKVAVRAGDYAGRLWEVLETVMLKTQNEIIEGAERLLENE